ncbi:DUF2934 domain-containing protein [Propionivibrio sp.]|uniref:DUF2934 domain-containing protein n=1 Tax=Propionivibrio sp. TaxID=2212460 RepID=UPI003BF2F0D9
MKTRSESENNPVGNAILMEWQEHRSEERGSLSGNDDFQQRIAEAAFYHAKRRNFEPGHDWADWFKGEAEIKG